MSDRTETLRRDGAVLFAAAAAPALPCLHEIAAKLPKDRPGVRLSGADDLNGLLAADGVIGAVAAEAIGQPCRPVRALLFDKGPTNNWSLGWHQDRTICVTERREATGFSPWTIKRGLHHVEPPFAILAAMVTLRVHLDDVDEDNAPLLIAPGSHRRGRIPVHAVGDVVAHCGIRVCMARSGDVWAYATPVLHASEGARRASRRRVLQVDYSPSELPGGLRWLGV